MELTLSKLGHTWILDLDGTILEHNGYLSKGGERFLPGAQEFLASVPEKDMVIFVTSRCEEYRESTLSFLDEAGINYAAVVFDAPLGERVLMNDMKPSGLQTAISINVARDGEFDLCIRENPHL